MRCDFEIIDDGTRLRCKRPGCPFHRKPRRMTITGQLPVTECLGADPGPGPLPPWWKRGWNLLQEATKHVFAGMPQAERQTAEERLAICRLCPRFDGQHCVDCGCNMKRAVAWELKECPLEKWPGQKHYQAPSNRPADFHLSLRAGLGDAVQFTQVVERLAREYPDASIELVTNYPRVFEGKDEGERSRSKDEGGRMKDESPEASAHSSFILHPSSLTSDGRPRLRIVEHASETHPNQARWPEPKGVFADAPATKAQHCLFRDFGLAPESSQYRFVIRDSERSHVAQWIARVKDEGERSRSKDEGERMKDESAEASAHSSLRLVLLHFSGVSWSAEKNFPLAVVEAAVRAVLDAGGLPLLLDQAGSMPRIEGAIRVPASVTPGVGELAALIEAVDLFVGIDSGPGHLAGAVRGKKEDGRRKTEEVEPEVSVSSVLRPPSSILCWKSFHPLHYFPADNGVLHLVPADHQRLIRGNDSAATTAANEYFARAYQHATYLDSAHGIARAIRQTLRGEPVDMTFPAAPLPAIERGEITIIAPQGIGDLFWIHRLLHPHFTKIHYQVRVSHKHRHDVQRRAHGWIQSWSKGGTLEFVEASDAACAAPLEQCFPVGELLRRYDAGERAIVYSANHWLEAGLALEDLAGDQPIAWDLDVQCIWRDAICPTRKTYTLVYVSGDTSFNAPRDLTWSVREWAKCLSLCTQRDEDVVLIGAPYDGDVLCELDWLLRKKHDRPNVRAITHAQPTNVTEIIANARRFIGYQSGLNVLADHFSTPQVMLYFDDHRHHLMASRWTWQRPQNRIAARHLALQFSAEPEAAAEQVKQWIP